MKIKSALSLTNSKEFNPSFKKNFAKNRNAFCKVFVFMFLFAFLMPLVHSNTSVYISAVTVRADNGADCIVDTGTPNPGVDVSTPITTASNFWGQNAALIEFDDPTTVLTNTLTLAAPSAATYPGACLSLCATLKCTNTGNPQNPAGAAVDFPIENMRFEIFKFLPGSNPLNATSAPALRTVFMYNIGKCLANSSDAAVSGGDSGTFCTAWDGSYNIDGVTDFGKTNGNYGFRATAVVNWVTQSSGSVNVTTTAAYPGQDQYPIRLDVTNIHSITTTPTVVGQLTGVAAQPYNVQYRLSKDANVTMQVIASDADPDSPGASDIYRTIVDNLPRTGEGVPNGTLLNGDAWLGDHDNGKKLIAGDYTLVITATSTDQWGTDVAQKKWRTISLDPLRVTDIRVKALGSTSTDLAEFTYVLTEPASVTWKIYTPGTEFDDVNDTTTVPPTIQNLEDGTTASGTLVATITEQKAARQDVITTWDGKNDSTSAPVADGNYVYVMYAEMPGYDPTAAGTVGDPNNVTLRTKKFYTGVVPVNRGLVVTSQLAPASSVIGTNPTAGSLSPYTFKYTLSRDSLVTLRILTEDGATVVKTIASNETRPANFTNTDVWDGVNDDGYKVEPNVYLAELQVIDAFVPTKISRRTTLFPVNQFRVVDVVADSLSGEAADQASVKFLMSEPMIVNLKVYDPGTIIDASSWPPTIMGTPTPVAYKTMVDDEKLPGRSVITQFWDGLRDDSTTQIAPDGEYVYVLTAKAQAPIAVYPDTDGGTDGYTDFDLNSAYYAPDKTTGRLSVFRGPVFLDNVNIIPFAPELTTSKESIEIPPYSIEFEVSRIAFVTIKIISETRCGASPYTDNVCRTLVNEEVFLSGQTSKATWDGRDDFSNYLPADDYIVQITASDYPDTSLHTPTVYQTAIEFNPFRVYDIQLSDITEDNGEALIRYKLSEAMKVAWQIFEPGTTFNASGEPTPPIDESLVRVLVGNRPAQLQIDEIWDGLDKTGTPVPDGNYILRVVTSLDDDAVDNITGAINSIANVADLDAYLTSQYISVDRGKSADVCKDFEETVSVFPNPITTPNATIWITRLPTPGFYKMTLFDVAGYEVYKKDWGYLVPNSDHPNVEFTWTRTNSSNRKVARGVYFALFELKNSFGGKEVCQTVKNIMIK